MNQKSNIPVLTRNKKGEWTFQLKPLNYAVDDDNKSDNVFKPFFLDDISMTFSKIPVIYVSREKLKAINLRNNESVDMKDPIACPYAPKKKDQ
ncbi:hypothetical protein M9Y10_038118 [Tritrichomonas musculus]|uniref:Uncharacterized protein n=1 Tax=Tritrichomonas musculus TaxID=1915356 RepID=A0ABR2K838_9EUKA